MPPSLAAGEIADVVAGALSLPPPAYSAGKLTMRFRLSYSTPLPISRPAVSYSTLVLRLPISGRPEARRRRSVTSARKGTPGLSRVLVRWATFFWFETKDKPVATICNVRQTR